MIDPSDFDTAAQVAGLIVLVGLLATSAGLQDGPGEPRVFEGCIDGDTCYWSDIDRPVRLARIDAPEIEHEMYAYDARNALVSKIKHADTVEVQGICTGLHGRLIAEVYADGVNLSTWMLRHGYADRYTGPVCGD